MILLRSHTTPVKDSSPFVHTVLVNVTQLLKDSIHCVNFAISKENHPYSNERESSKQDRNRMFMFLTSSSLSLSLSLTHSLSHTLIYWFFTGVCSLFHIWNEVILSNRMWAGMGNNLNKKLKTRIPHACQE